jgi:hypothetical protein
MGFIPQSAAGPDAIFANLRVTLANNIHVSERVLDVTLDSISDLAHHSTVFADGTWLSTLELWQSLYHTPNCDNAWTFFANHGARVRSHLFKYFDECVACQNRALDRLRPGG